MEKCSALIEITGIVGKHFVFWKIGTGIIQVYCNVSKQALNTFSKLFQQPFLITLTEEHKVDKKHLPRLRQRWR